MITYIKTYQYGFGLAHGFGASTGGIGTYWVRILVCIDPYIVILHILSTYWTVLKLLVLFMHVLIPIVHVYTY